MMGLEDNEYLAELGEKELPDLLRRASDERWSSLSIGNYQFKLPLRLSDLPGATNRFDGSLLDPIFEAILEIATHLVPCQHLLRLFSMSRRKYLLAEEKPAYRQCCLDRAGHVHAGHRPAADGTVLQGQRR